MPIIYICVQNASWSHPDPMSTQCLHGAPVARVPVTAAIPASDLSSCSNFERGKRFVCPSWPSTFWGYDVTNVTTDSWNVLKLIFKILKMWHLEKKKNCWTCWRIHGRLAIPVHPLAYETCRKWLSSRSMGSATYGFDDLPNLVVRIPSVSHSLSVMALTAGSYYMVLPIFYSIYKYHAVSWLVSSYCSKTYVYEFWAEHKSIGQIWVQTGRTSYVFFGRWPRCRSTCDPLPVMNLLMASVKLTIPMQSVVFKKRIIQELCSSGCPAVNYILSFTNSLPFLTSL